jgi:hypothetical protein
VTSFIGTFQDVIQRLEKENIEYIIVGSLAAMVYGEPRLTRDMDLVLDIHPKDATKLEGLFPQPDFYCPPIEILSDEIRNRGQFNLLHVQTGLKVDVVIKKTTPFDQSRFERKQRLELWQDFPANLATAEDVIIKKLEFYREGGSEKYIRDIRGIVSNTKVDQAYLQKWITELRLENEWTKI